ncbi:MAG TPA: hypothetical protein VK211_12525 [Kamptonema sp.]|nr:hypothetical protein [Kamptonema sp.]
MYSHLDFHVLCSCDVIAYKQFLSITWVNYELNIADTQRSRSRLNPY